MEESPSPSFTGESIREFPSLNGLFPLEFSVRRKTLRIASGDPSEERP